MSWSPLDASNPTDDQVIGDEPFDLISQCFDRVAKLYKRDWKRKPTLKELIGTVQAVLEAQLQDHTRDGQTAELVGLSFKTRKIPKRQKYFVGDILKAVAANGQPVYARIFEIIPQLGPLVGVYDSIGMAETDLEAIIARPLIVKLNLIHRENLEKRAWLVIGNRPVTGDEQKLPRVRPHLSVSGSNSQLEAANYHYGFLKEKPFYDADNWLIREKPIPS
jgi:hypothetical protein